MSELRIERWTINASAMGADNPLPPLNAPRDLHAIQGDSSIPADMLERMTFGHVPSILPYSMQDGYTREVRPTETPVAVLENDILRAAFLLEYGGRLWSLQHKPSQRELLSMNPTVQFANLALRNAWFAGGVEWNIGTIGHSPFTCAPLFAARLNKPDSTPVLRMYEWERIRQVPFQIDAFLPDGSPVLYVAIRISNPHDHVIPMYWWSNMAVSETPETRVVVPAESVYHYDYGQERLRLMGLPAAPDFTYATHIRPSADYFFHIQDGQTPWIAALDGKGKGLVQVSTQRLMGRKLFVWGIGSGGRRWQRWLSPTGDPYIEIQAGLARTQMEHLPMPARTDWSWLEAYGMLDADSRAHAGAWSEAWQSTHEAVVELVDPTVLDRELQAHLPVFDQPPAELIQQGSGWGTLEEQRRRAAGEPEAASPGLVFDASSLTSAQTSWLGLLEQGVFKETSEADSIGFMIQPEWQTLLETAAHDNRVNWSGWLHLGIMRLYADDRDGARLAWEISTALKPTAWGYRNLGLLAMRQKEFEKAASFYLRAYQMKPEILPLAVECGLALIAADRSEDWLALLATMPEELACSGRIRLVEALAALKTGEIARVKQFFADQVVIGDIREGETSLTDLWIALHRHEFSASDGALPEQILERHPLPELFDFRLHMD